MGVPPLGPTIKPGQKFGENPTKDLPADHPLILEFGNYQPEGHSGFDYPAPLGTPVYATEDGVVTWAADGLLLPGDESHAGFISRYYLVKWATGNLVAIEHEAKGGYVSLTYHLQGFAPGIKPFVRVKRGQLIGYCGSTGRSTGSHAHLDIIPMTYPWDNGRYGRVDPAPYLADPWPENPSPEPILPPLWVTGAVQRPQGLAVELNRSMPPRAVWHITSDVDPGKTQPPFTNVATYLVNAGYCPHLMWDPFTGHMEQYYPANVGGRALASWNEDGKFCFQIEVLFSAGALRNGKRYDVLADTPMKGYADILLFLDKLGIPRRWPMGEPPRIHTQSRRDVEVWNTQAGHYGHVHVPGNDHTDPGTFPPLTGGPAVPPAPPNPLPPPVPNPAPVGVHVVKAGETLRQIADRYKVSVPSIRVLNKYITNPNYLAVGDKVRIPKAGEKIIHVAAPGDTVIGIANRYSTTITALQAANPYIKNPSYLAVGDRVAMPVTPGPRIHTIRPGDTLAAVAALYKTTVPAIRALNAYIKDPRYIAVNDRVTLPL